MEQVQMIDIQYYNHFISTNCNDSVKVSKIQQYMLRLYIYTYLLNINVFMKQKNTNKGVVSRHITRPTVSVPSLDILSSENLFFSHGPNAIEIMHVSKVIYFSS